MFTIIIFVLIIYVLLLYYFYSARGLWRHKRPACNFFSLKSSFGGANWQTRVILFLPKTKRNYDNKSYTPDYYSLLLLMSTWRSLSNVRSACVSSRACRTVFCSQRRRWWFRTLSDRRAWNGCRKRKCRSKFYCVSTQRKSMSASDQLLIIVSCGFIPSWGVPTDWYCGGIRLGSVYLLFGTCNCYYLG